MSNEALHILLTTHNPPQDYSTYLQLLQTCILKKTLSQGQKVHSFVSHRWFAFATHTIFHNKLIQMYFKCGRLADARKVFDHMKERDNQSWNSIIAAYRKQACPNEAVKLFHHMQRSGFQPDKFTFANILPACGRMGDLEQGTDIHQSIKDEGILSDVRVASALVDMYAKCGNVEKARELFDRMPRRDVCLWTAMIAGYGRNGFYENALETFKQMQLVGVKPNSTTFASILPACAKMGALEQGIDIHRMVKEEGFLSDVIVATALVDMYGKCGSINKARELFDKMPGKDVISWNAMIAGYAQNGLVDKALETLKQMQSAEIKPNSTTFAGILPACAKIGVLQQGMEISEIIEDRKILSDVVVATALVDMYAKCGNIDKARELFDEMPVRNVVSWNAMLVGYAQNGFVEKVLETFKNMLLVGVKPDSTTFTVILHACAKMRDLEQGTDIHQSIEEGGFISDVTVATALIDMYAKCDRIDKACELFDRVSQRDVISWNAMLAGYAQNGFVDEALETFKQMQLAGVKPNSTTFTSILPACAKKGALEQGMNIHQSIMEAGLMSDIIVGNALLVMYAKCGSTDKAHNLFERMPQRDAISWNAMIAGYIQNGFVDKALQTFKQMQLAGVQLDSTTFVSILPTCGKMEALEEGMGVHQSIIEGGSSSDIIVGNALIDMYAKCGRMDKAYELFRRIPQRNVFSWNAIIAGYAQNGLVEKALETFKEMQLTSLKPNSTTFASILPTCGKMGALEQGMSIHQSINEGEFLSDIIVATALLDMYAKCGSTDKAYELFDRMPQRDVITWNAMIAGYGQNGFVDNALKTFKQMNLAGVKPNSTTFASILPTCAKTGALEQGMDIHQRIMEGGFLSDIIVGNSLVDMYAKCGNIAKAQKLFDRMPQRDVISWNAMIAGYGQNGFCKDALKMFEIMKLSGTHPDIASFACVLCACSHAGFVDEGCTYFNEMSNSYCISPTADHYVCMVDLLGRAGYLANTLNFIIKMPIEPMVVLWMCFLGSCRSYMNLGLGVYTAKLLFDLDPTNAATYVLLSNIYVEVGRWDEAQMIRRLMKDRGIEKIPGCSWIEARKVVSHPQTQEIYER